MFKEAIEKMIANECFETTLSYLPGRHNYTVYINAKAKNFHYGTKKDMKFFENVTIAVIVANNLLYARYTYKKDMETLVQILKENGFSEIYA